MASDRFVEGFRDFSWLVTSGCGFTRLVIFQAAVYWHLAGVRSHGRRQSSLHFMSFNSCMPLFISRMASKVVVKFVWLCLLIVVEELRLRHWF